MSEIKCINLSYVVSSDNAGDVENVFKKHASWMNEFYAEENEGKEHLISCYFTKAQEFVDPTDPTKGFTGNIIFTINEKFTSMKSVERHVENASKNEYFGKFVEILGAYGKSD